jgi:hypothetical protein
MPDNPPEFSPEHTALLLSRLSPVDREHYAALMKRYDAGMASQWQIEKLIVAGFVPKPVKAVNEPELTDAGGKDIPRYHTQQSRLAEFLHNHFSGRLSIKIKPMTIDGWRKEGNAAKILIGDKMVKPPKFPEKNQAENKWVTQECIDWVEKWIAANPRYQKTAPNTAPSGFVDRKDEMEEIALRRAKREEAFEEGRLMEVDLAVTIAGSELRRQWDECKQFNEKTEIDEFDAYSKSIGVPAELLTLQKAKLTQSRQAFTDRFEAANETAVGQIDDLIKQKMQEQRK